MPRYLSAMRLFMVVPEVISILDYRRGFGHSDLVTVKDVDGGTELGTSFVKKAVLRLAESFQLAAAPASEGGSRHRLLSGAAPARGARSPCRK